MALAERAELVARLSLKDDFSGRLKGATSSLRGMEGSLGRIAKLGRSGLASATANLAKLGAVAGGFVALNVKSGISSLAELEDATVSVDGAIKAMGLTGQLTSRQVAQWANEIESSVQAAFDDKEITQAATSLLRFGKITPANLRPAMVVMTDLAAKTGDVGTAGELLAKSLAAPEKAAGRLVRQGIILTDVEQKQIAAMVKAGKVGEAQALVLASIAKQTQGAAAAAKGPYNDAMNVFKDVTEDAQRALAEGFLPLLQRVAGKLSTFLADESNVQRIRDFGKDIADGFEKVLEIGGRIPWALIGSSLQTAGAGAKIILGAFTSLPPWVQQAVITGWGLNKLTGGALGGIVGELGKGLIRGVLGINAGVVNIKAGAVTGGGGVTGAAGGAGRAGGLASAVRVLGTVALAAGSIALIGELLSQRGQQSTENRAAAAALGVQTTTFTGGATLAQMKASLAGIEGYERQLASNLTPEGLAYAMNLDGVASAIRDTKVQLVSRINAQMSATDRVRDRIEAGRIAQVSATRSGDSSIVAAIKSNRSIVHVKVNTYQTTRVRVYQTGGTVNRSGAGSGPGGPMREEDLR